MLGEQLIPALPKPSEETSMAKSTNNQTPTTPLFEKLQAIPSAVQRADVVTTKDINPATGKNYTGKDKRVLGIPEGNNVIWTWPHFSQHDHATICGTAKAVGKPVGQFLAEVVMNWLDENRTELEEIARDHRKEAKTEDQIKRELAAAERQMARLKGMLEEPADAELAASAAE
jgi:hypothetical protein